MELKLNQSELLVYSKHHKGIFMSFTTSKIIHQLDTIKTWEKENWKKIYFTYEMLLL